MFYAHMYSEALFSSGMKFKCFRETYNGRAELVATAEKHHFHTLTLSLVMQYILNVFIVIILEGNCVISHSASFLPTLCPDTLDATQSIILYYFVVYHIHVITSMLS